MVHKNYNKIVQGDEYESSDSEGETPSEIDVNMTHDMTIYPVHGRPNETKV